MNKTTTSNKTPNIFLLYFNSQIFQFTHKKDSCAAAHSLLFTVNNMNARARQIATQAQHGAALSCLWELMSTHWPFEPYSKINWTHSTAVKIYVQHAAYKQPEGRINGYIETSSQQRFSLFSSAVVAFQMSSHVFQTRRAKLMCRVICCFPTKIMTVEIAAPVITPWTLDWWIPPSSQPGATELCFPQSIFMKAQMWSSMMSWISAGKCLLSSLAASTVH